MKPIVIPHKSYIQNMKQIVFFLLVLLLLQGCSGSPEVIDDFSNQTFTFFNQDSAKVNFPEDFGGDYVVMGFIYTHCPDICPLITQNLIKTQQELNYPDDVQFIALTFDPERDKPSVLKKYANAFNTGKNFHFLTGDSTQVNAFLDSARVRVQISMRKITSSDKEIYFMNHSDKIMVFDKKGRVIFEYGGSMKMVPYIIAEDLNKIR